MRGTTLRRGGATTLGDLRGLSLPGERTTLLRFALAVALAACFAGVVLLARDAGSGRAAVLPGGVRTGVIVVDMSGSVSGSKWERIATVMRGLVTANQGVGLVMFSYTAYELLPPNSPTSSLLQFERFFTPTSLYHGQPVFGVGPGGDFIGGTRISTGLLEGLHALRSGGLTHGSLLLLSDLNDSSTDTQALIAAAFTIKRAHVPVRIVPLGAAADNVRIFSSLFGSNVFIPPSAYQTTSTRQVQPVAASWPWTLMTVGAVLVALLTANELFNTRLRPEAAA